MFLQNLYKIRFLQRNTRSDSARAVISVASAKFGEPVFCES